MISDTDLINIKQLTRTQAEFLRVLIENPDKTITANASGASQVHFSGKIIAGIRKYGIIDSFGKNGRQTQWGLTPEWEKKAQASKDSLLNLIDKISK